MVVLEAFLHAVQHLREKTGIDFGAVAFDDCYSSLHITSVLSDFLSGLVPFDKVGGSCLSVPVTLLVSDCSCHTAPVRLLLSHCSCQTALARLIVSVGGRPILSD